MAQCYPWFQETLWNEYNMQHLFRTNGLSHLTPLPADMGCNTDFEEVSNKTPFWHLQDSSALSDVAVPAQRWSAVVHW